MKAYIMVKIRAGELKDVVQQIQKIKDITEAHVTFGPYDAIAVVETVDLTRIGSIVAQEIQPISGVEQTLTCLAVDV